MYIYFTLFPSRPRSCPKGQSISLGRLCPVVVRCSVLERVAVHSICPHGQYISHGTRHHISVTKLPLHCIRLPCTIYASVITIHFCIFWKSFSTSLSRNTTYPHEAPHFFPSFFLSPYTHPPPQHALTLSLFYMKLHTLETFSFTHASRVSCVYSVNVGLVSEYVWLF